MGKCCATERQDNRMAKKHINSKPNTNEGGTVKKFKSCKRIVEDHNNSELNSIAIGLIQTEVVKLETELWFKDQEAENLNDEVDHLIEQIDDGDFDDEELLKAKKKRDAAEWEAYRLHLVIDRYRKHLNAKTTLPVE